MFIQPVSPVVHRSRSLWAVSEMGFLLLGLPLGKPLGPKKPQVVTKQVGPNLATSLLVQPLGPTDSDALSAPAQQWRLRSQSLRVIEGTKLRVSAARVEWSVPPCGATRFERGLIWQVKNRVTPVTALNK